MIWGLIWLAGNFILLAAALAHISDAGVVLGRYSVAYAAALAVGFGLIIVTAIFGITRSGQRALDRVAVRFNSLAQRHGLKLIAALALLLLIPLIIFFSLPADIQYIMLLVLFSVIMLLVTLGTRSVSDAAPSAGYAVNRLLWVLLAAVVVVSFFSAHAVPAEQSSGDEVAWTNMAATLNATGQAYIKFSGQDVFLIAPGAGWWVAPYGLWLRAFGISLSAGRLFIWLIYLASVGCIGWAAARLYDRTTGLIAAILTASSLFLLNFRIIRPEIGLAAIGALLVLLYLASQKRPLWAFAAGWLAILSLEIHAAGLAYIVALILMFATDGLIALIQRRNPFERRQFALAAGLAWGSALYVLLHIFIMTDFATYVDYLRSTRGFLEGNGLLRELSRATLVLWQHGLLESVLVVVALGGLLLRRTPHDRLVLRFFGAVLVSYFVLIPEPHRYLVIFLPFMLWSVAAFFRFGYQASLTPIGPAFSLLAVVAFSAPFFAVSLPGFALNPMPPTPTTPVIERARELSTDEDTVVGDAFAWWGMTDYSDFYAPWAEFELIRGLGYSSGGELWTGLNPALVFYVYRPGFPEMPSALRAYLDEQSFVLVDAFEWEGHHVEFWQRPDRVR